MAPRTWRIEIVCDYQTQTQNKTMDDAVRTQAKILLTQAMLLQDRREPQIVVESEDAFTTSKEIMLVDAQQEDATPEGQARAGEGAKSENAAWARGQGYTVADKDGGWRYNDPDGVWSTESFTTEAAAWEGAFASLAQENKP